MSNNVVKVFVGQIPKTLEEDGVRELELTLAKGLGRSRACEDEVVSRCALLLLAAEGGLSPPTGPWERELWQTVPGAEVDDDAMEPSAERREQLQREELPLLRFTAHDEGGADDEARDDA